jgi:hypothetical protein
MLSLAGFSDFARHYFRNLGWCLFLELLRCFSSPGLPRTPMYSVCDTFRWVSPFRDLRVTGYLPPRRSLSQAFTSFVAYHCQGIHHMLLVTWPYNFDACSRKLQNYFQGPLDWLLLYVIYQSRYAVIEVWIFKLLFYLIYSNLSIEWTIDGLSQSLMFILDAIKNSLLLLAARITKLLRTRYFC